MHNRRRWIWGAAVIAVAVPSAAAWAQSAAYPARTVRMIVPWPAGGGTDMLARPIAQKLSDRLGQSVVVDNRGGASGIVGSEVAAKAAPDGYTILVDNVTSHATNITLYPKLTYNSLRDYAPVSLLTTVSNIVVVHPSVPAKSIRELVSLAKARPGELSFATYGTGGTTHLAGEMFKGLAGIEMVHVPYKGGAPALVDVVAGHVPVYFSVLSTSAAHVKTGKLRARRNQCPARSGFSGHSHHRRVGLCRLRGKQLVRPADARGRTTRHHRQAQCGNPRGAQAARCSRAAGEPGQHDIREHPRAAARAHERRNPEMGEGHQSRGRPPRMTRRVVSLQLNLGAAVTKLEALA